MAKDLAIANKPAKKAPTKKPTSTINKAKKSTPIVPIRQKLLARGRPAIRKRREEVIYVLPKQVVVLVVAAVSRGSRAITLPQRFR